MTFHIGRRGFLRGMGAAAGVAAASRLSGLGTAHAAGEKSAVVVIHLVGGYNSVFCSADSFAPGVFKVGAKKDLGNGLVVDDPTLGQLPAWALQHMATIGNRHGSSDHAEAIRRLWSDGTHNYSLQLASAMGGTAPIKCAQVAGPGVDYASPAEGGVSVQGIGDMSSVIETLAGGDAKAPDRKISSSGMASAEKMSKRIIEASPILGTNMNDGFDTAADALGKLPPPFDYRGLPAQYGLGGTGIGAGFASKLCAAELMIRAGTNVINLFSENDWDTHKSDGNKERFLLAVQLIGPLKTFLTRISDPAGLGATHNVVVAIMGDFARSLPGDDHQPNLSITVIGKHVKVGTTGRVAGNVSLPGGTPGSREMWGYLAAAAKAPSNPFGGNPHGLVL